MSKLSLKHKKILVTGASSGIGLVTSAFCSTLGAEVILSGRNENRLREALSNLEGTGHRYVSADITEDSSVDILLEKIDSLDGIVFCAGVNDKQIIKAISREKAEDMFNINVLSPIIITKKLLKQKKINKGASIVFISSIASYYAAISNTVYAATKGAINSIVRVWALELSNKLIRVNAILPGMINTGMIDSYQFSEEEKLNMVKQYPLGRIGTTQDVSNAVAFFLSDLSSWITGTCLVVDGGVTLR